MRLPSWVGDAVAAEPAVAALAEHLAARGETGALSLAAPAHVLELFAGRFPGSRRLPLAEAPPPGAWRGHRTALLLTGSFRSAWAAQRAGIPRRIGWSRDGRRLLLTEALAPPLERGLVPPGLGLAGGGRRHLPRPFGASCAELLALAGVPVRRRRPRLLPGAEDEARAESRLASLGLEPREPFLLVNVGGRPGSAKSLPRELWGSLLAELAGAVELPLVLVHGPGEDRGLRVPGRGGACSEPAPGLGELAALAARSRLLVTADQGPRHVAHAVGTPVLCLLGPTDPRHTAEHDASTRLLRIRVPCGPCHLERCPLPGADERRCFRGIEPGRVVAAARGLLGRADERVE